MLKKLMNTSQIRPTFKTLCLLALTTTMIACEGASLSGREKGALGGGAVGAGLGAIIGHATGHTGEGIAIGAVTGALGGGLLGNQSDNVGNAQAEQDERLRRQEEMILQQQRELDELKRSRGDSSYDARPSAPSDYDRRDDYRY